MQRYVGWTDGDAKRVAAMWPLVSPQAKSLIDDFYAEIQRHPNAARVITGGPEQIERLSQTLREWLAQLFAGKYDIEYISRRWRSRLSARGDRARAAIYELGDFPPADGHQASSLLLLARLVRRIGGVVDVDQQAARS